MSIYRFSCSRGIGLSKMGIRNRGSRVSRGCAQDVERSKIGYLVGCVTVDEGICGYASKDSSVLSGEMKTRGCAESIAVMNVREGQKCLEKTKMPLSHNSLCSIYRYFASQLDKKQNPPKALASPNSSLVCKIHHKQKANPLSIIYHSIIILKLTKILFFQPRNSKWTPRQKPALPQSRKGHWQCCSGYNWP